MTCRHAKGDPNCSSTVGGYAHSQMERERDAAHQKELDALKAKLPKTPDSANYQIAGVERIGLHLVLKVTYPNCAKCAYEGNKVMGFLNVTEADVLKWRIIDPHFRNPKEVINPGKAPPPAARFPASAEGWSDAIAYTREARTRRRLLDAQMPVDGHTRKEGERVRMWHALARMRATLDNLELALTMSHPIGNDTAGAITAGAIELAMQIAKYDAFDLAERDSAAIHLIPQQS